ncbi:MAG: type ISP restriction/modification enzyme [bacterium]
MKPLLEQYLKNLLSTSNRGDAREETYYEHLKALVVHYADLQSLKNVDVTILPKQTEAGNPDFRIWDGKNHITGYIEAKDPSVSNLDHIEDTEQLKRYRSTFPNVILTNFYEFRLYRDGKSIAQVMIGRPVIAQKLKTPPPVEHIDQFKELFDLFFSFSLPKVHTAKTLAIELAKRTRFLRDEVITVEMAENGSKGHNQIVGFYEAFKTYLIGTLNEKQFADLYAQTITYGLFAARTRADGEFNRRVAFDYIPHTIGILRDVFRFISLEEPPKSLKIIVEDIAEILNVADVNKILHEYHITGKGKDPIIHFYETFLTTYDPQVRERRGVYYTPEPVVRYIVRAIHSILKSHFGLADGLASEEVKLLDPAAGTLTFPAEAIRLAVQEHIEKYGEGDLHQWIKKTILQNYYAFELMMAPYAIGHLKMGFIFEEIGYKMADDERFKLYLTNTLEMEDIKQVNIPVFRSLTAESHLAGEVKKDKPILIILGNPPYSGNSANVSGERIYFNKGEKFKSRYVLQEVDDDNFIIDPILKIAKKNIHTIQKTWIGEQIEYYKIVDGNWLNEKNPKMLQDDYVKFLRFAQWKIKASGYGIVGMITNHGFLDNPTFRGMRQSLINTFDEIYILDLHGNSIKKETTPDGSKDENVFDIRQGVSISLFIKNREINKRKVYHKDLYGTRDFKYSWLESNLFNKNDYIELNPKSPWYFFIPRHTEKINHYLNWKCITDIFLINNSGIKTHRDNLVIDFDENPLKNRIIQFRNSTLPDDILLESYNLKNTTSWNISTARQKLSSDDNWDCYFEDIVYRPFDVRKIYYSDTMIDRSRKEIVLNLLKENLSICFVRQFSGNVPYSHFLITNNMVDNRTFFSSKGTIQQAPLYIYPEEKKKSPGGGGFTTMILFEPKERYGRKPNIAPFIFEKLESIYKKRPDPEEILYYIYGVFYSNIYRETYAEFLKIDFPRVPFTADYTLFKTISKLGNTLADLHLLKSSLLDIPIARYQGSSDNSRVEKITYNEDEQRIYINQDKYFEGIKPQVWQYHIGGYQVLHKYLKDRKGRIMDDAPRYCRIVTALSKTIEIQEEIDKAYSEVEKNLINF